MKPFLLFACCLVISNTTIAQQFTYPTSGNAVNNQLPELISPDGVSLIASIRSTGCTPGPSSNFQFSASHVSTGAIYRNTSWAAGCIGSYDIIKFDFTARDKRPMSLRFSIYDVDNGSDSVSVMIYSFGTPVAYTYALYAPTFVVANGASPSFGFNGSGSNNSGLDDNRGRIDITSADPLAVVDSVIILKRNNRDVVGNPSQSFAAMGWDQYIILPFKIINFSAVKQADGLRFNWKSANEIGTENYQVEYSTDGKKFVATGNSVASKGISNEMSYSYDLPFPTSNKMHYFRLQGKTMDGKYFYSSIVSVSREIQKQSIVYPVVFIKTVTVSVEASNNTKGMVRLMGMDGSLYYQQTVFLQKGANNIKMNLPENLPAGSYALIGKLDNGNAFRHIIIK